MNNYVELYEFNEDNERNINLEIFKRTIFPVKHDGKIEQMSGEKILYNCHLSSFPFLKGTKEIYPVFSFLALNVIFYHLDYKDKIVVDNFFRNLRAQNMDDNLHYVNGFVYYGYKDLVSDLVIIYDPLIGINEFECEKIVNYINENYTYNNYEKAYNYTIFAEKIYKKCPKDDRHLYLVAKYGLMAYQYKDAWFNLWKKTPVIRLDYFWITLCNVLKKLKRFDEAIEIARCGYENDAYDTTTGGWKARLEKLEKAKIKSL